MKVSRSTGYAILAAGYMVKNQKEPIILSQRIAKEYNIPLEYLLKILQQLVRANVLNSKRGPRGGFSLARSPREITMLEIVEAVDGPMISTLNMAKQAKGEKFGAKAELVYKKAIAQSKAVFARTKLADIMKK
ncbi:MAG: RrF2 family transcriptional regulator [Planctomycetota bacterium]|jgi:Rrf2 family protein